jgi:hypothetical protein
MHYCCKIGGKTLIFSDMPVNIAWDSDRLAIADEIAEETFKKFNAETDVDKNIIRDHIREAFCTKMPATFTKDKELLKAKIAKEVHDNLDSKNFKFGSSHINNGHSWRQPWNEQIVKSTNTKTSVDHKTNVDLAAMWTKAQRLQCIGYELVDPESKDPNHYVKKDDAKKARGIYKKIITELNSELRKYGGVGVGDLVLVDPEMVKNDPSLSDMVIEPNEIEDFSIKNGLVSYEVGGEVFWGDELTLVNKYEDIMDWKVETV